MWLAPTATLVTFFSENISEGKIATMTMGTKKNESNFPQINSDLFLMFINIFITLSCHYFFLQV